MKSVPKIYTIYSATSPSDKRYIGMTGVSLAKRWTAHIRRSRLENTTHPFVQALNKYGPENFTLEVISQTHDQDEAKKMEIESIFTFGTYDRAFGYNISRGGDYDSITGAAAMRERLKDPKFRATYLAKLSNVKKNADWTDYAALTKATLDWRKRNPRLAYKIGYRNIRLATKAQNRVFTASHDKDGTFGRFPIDSVKVLEARRRYLYKRLTQEMWDARSEEDRREIGRRISVGAKAALKKDPKRKAANDLRLASHRATMDRAVQGPAASRGLKAWWAKLKTDPERFAAHIRARADKAKISNKLWWDRVKADPGEKEMLERKIAKFKATMHLRHPKRRAEK